jgi:hypothetical protein
MTEYGSDVDLTTKQAHWTCRHLTGIPNSPSASFIISKLKMHILGSFSATETLAEYYALDWSINSATAYITFMLYLKQKRTM